SAPADGTGCASTMGSDPADEIGCASTMGSDPTGALGCDARTEAEGELDTASKTAPPVIPAPANAGPAWTMRAARGAGRDSGGRRPERPRRHAMRPCQPACSKSITGMAPTHTTIRLLNE